VKPSTVVRVLLIAVIVALCASAAMADSVLDPTIVIRDPACPSGGCVSVGSNFTFGVPNSGFGTLFFTNASGINWFSLKLTESGVAANAITCITTAFANCSVSTINGVTTILVSGVNGGFTGIKNGENFSIVFQCNDGNCWPGGLDFTATASTPEPGTMALLATGIGALWTRRKLRKGAVV
jgi:hypothetical protein